MPRPVKERREMGGRMKQNRLVYALIQSAVEKGIRDVREDPKRGSRNLVELGAMFAKGAGQKAFFELLQQELQNDDSVYYRLVEQVFRDTRPEALSTFCMNLGYTGLICGARHIRKLRAQEGMNIPWCLYLLLEGGGAELALPTVRQGKELGVYCYILLADSAPRGLEQATTIAQSEPDCAFIALVSAPAVNASAAAAAGRCDNIMIAVNIEDEAVEKAVEELRSAQCLYGGFTRTCGQMPSHEQLARCVRLAMAVLLTADTVEERPAGWDAQSAEITRLRRSLTAPVLPLDLYTDVISISGYTDTARPLTVILPDGAVVRADPQTGAARTGHNLHRDALADVFYAAGQHSPAPA